MDLTEYNFELNFANESVETLLLMAVLGQEAVRYAVLCEIKRRQAINIDLEDLDSAFMTNLSGIC